MIIKIEGFMDFSKRNIGVQMEAYLRIGSKSVAWHL
jgi:hypothetical protein